jgi:hypothetical protein
MIEGVAVHQRSSFPTNIRRQPAATLRVPHPNYTASVLQGGDGQRRLRDKAFLPLFQEERSGKITQQKLEFNVQTTKGKFARKHHRKSQPRFPEQNSRAKNSVKHFCEMTRLALPVSTSKLDPLHLFVVVHCDHLEDGKTTMTGTIKYAVSVIFFHLPRWWSHLSHVIFRLC